MTDVNFSPQSSFRRSSLKKPNESSSNSKRSVSVSDIVEVCAADSLTPTNTRTQSSLYRATSYELALNAAEDDDEQFRYAGYDGYDDEEEVNEVFVQQKRSSNPNNGIREAEMRDFTPSRRRSSGLVETKTPASNNNHSHNNKNTNKTFKLHLTDTLSSFALLRVFGIELIGVAFYIYFGVGCVLNTAYTSTVVPETSLLLVAFGNSVSYAIALCLTLRKAEGYLNPIASVCLFLSGEISLRLTVVFVIGQLLGCILGTAFIKASFPEVLLGHYHYGATTIRDITPESGSFVEMLLTSLLLLSILHSRQASLPMRAMLPGLVLFASHLLAFPLTGASLNPVRSFGPALLSGHWSHHWIYWGGPALGLPLALFLHVLLFGEDLTLPRVTWSAS